MVFLRTEQSARETLSVGFNLTTHSIALSGLHIINVDNNITKIEQYSTRVGAFWQTARVVMTRTDCKVF